MCVCVCVRVFVTLYYTKSAQKIQQDDSNSM